MATPRTTIAILGSPRMWITKYRYRVLRGELQRRVRTIVVLGVPRIAEEMGVKIINGVVSSDHIHLFVSIPPHIPVSEFVQRAKGRSSRKVQQEFEELRKRYWGRHFWGRGYPWRAKDATSGNVTDEMINEYINSHYDAHKHNDEESISLE